MNLDSAGARTLARQIVLASELKEVKKEETKWERRRQVCCELITPTQFTLLPQLLICSVLISLLFSVYIYPMRVMQQQDIDKFVERALQTAERLKQDKRDVMRRATPRHDESLWICPLDARHNATLHTHTLMDAMDRLLVDIKMQSPFNNVALWMCPQGVPGPIANTPHDLLVDYEAREQLNARCANRNTPIRHCNMEETVEEVLRKMNYMPRADNRQTPDGMFGPYVDKHPKQHRYCELLIERYCDRQQRLPACDVFDELLSYGMWLVTSQARCPAGEPVMGAAGPPADMNPYQCDVYLKKQN
jgi:hypothetical protein